PCVPLSYRILPLTGVIGLSMAHLWLGSPVHDDRDRWSSNVASEAVHQESLAIGSDLVLPEHRLRPGAADTGGKQSHRGAGFEHVFLQVFSDRNRHEAVVERNVEQLFAVWPPPRHHTAIGGDQRLSSGRGKRSDVDLPTPRLVRR